MAIPDLKRLVEKILATACDMTDTKVTGRYIVVKVGVLVCDDEGHAEDINDQLMAHMNEFLHEREISNGWGTFYDFELEKGQDNERDRKQYS